MPFEAMVQGFDYPRRGPGLTPEIPAVNPEEPKKIDKRPTRSVWASPAR